MKTETGLRNLIIVAFIIVILIVGANALTTAVSLVVDIPTGKPVRFFISSKT